MDKQIFINELKGIIDTYLKDQGLELVDLIYRYEGRDLFLRVLVDKPEGGISLEECAGINRTLSNLLDEKNILQQRYILEVSSPGLDRPLKTKNEFFRCINRRARFFLKEPVNGRIELEGRIDKVDDQAVFAETEGRIMEIPLAKINKAKQIIGVG